MSTPTTSVQVRYQNALQSLTDKLQQDTYVLAAVLWGSLARGEAWHKSDIDLTIILHDGAKRTRPFVWLVEDGINIMAELIERSRLKQLRERSLQGSITHAIYAQSKLLFSKDESIVTWFEDGGRVNEGDQAFQLLRVAAVIPSLLDKVQKWFYWKRDLDYSFVWLLYTVDALARVETVLQGEAPGREVIHQALRYNPDFFHAVYTELIHGPKDEAAIQGALNRIDAYMSERGEQIFQPVLDYLAAAQAPRTAAEIDAHFKKKVQVDGIGGVYEWLTEKGIIEKVAAPIRLTKKSPIALEEPAYFYDGDGAEWE